MTANARKVWLVAAQCGSMRFDVNLLHVVAALARLVAAADGCIFSFREIEG